MAEFLAAKPAWLIFLYVVGGSVLLAAVATQLVHRRMKAPLDEKHNEVAGLMFATVSVLYAVLLAFVVIALWEQFSAAEQTAAQEATALIAAARTCTSFPEPARQQVHDLLIAYSNLVLNDE